MDTIQKKWSRCGSILLCLLCLLALVPVTAKAEETTTNQKPETVRVGWYEDSYHITGANGARSGYAYEYEQALAAYTGWNYEYVKGDWSELLQMLQNGEIDLIAALSYTDDRAQTMLFSDLPMGHEKYYLYADLSNKEISPSNLATLNGKRIVVMEDSVQATQFYDWEAQHNIQTQHINIDSFERAKEKALNHEIDGVISTETPAWVDANLSAIATTGGSDIYYGVNKKRPDLKEKLDEAMRKMEYDKPFYADELYQRYLSAQSVAVLSNDETQWLDQHGAIRIGCLNDDLGFSTKDAESGAFVGVLNDYIQYAANSLKNQTLAFELNGFDSQTEEIEALQKGEIDMIFHVNQNPYAAEDNGFALSNTVLTINLAAVTANDYLDESAANCVAVEKDNLPLQWFISYNYPDWQIELYDTFDGAVKAVRSGDADCFLVRTGELPEYLKDHNLHSVFLTKAGDVSFAVKRGNAVLLSVLNKTLKPMPASMLSGALSTYENRERKVTFSDYLKDNQLGFIAILSTLFLAILLLILGFLRKSQRAEAQARQAASQLQELNQKLQESQRELQAALLQAEGANSAKTTFLSNMSHDIRTPMNAIVGISNLMAAELNDPDKLREHIDKLQSSSQYLLSLINDILDMSKIEAGKSVLHNERMNLGEQVTQLDTIIRPQAQAKKQTLTIRTENLRHENVIGDPMRLRQVLLNILSNAVKYTNDCGKIDFTIEEIPREGHYARYKFTITDNGIGMTPEFMTHLYDSFARAENSVTNKVQGTGLGMAIAKNIVELMGGAIHADSTVGKGTRFEVTLDFHIDEQADASIQKMQILILDCSPHTLAQIQEAVLGKPVILQTAYGVGEAIKQLHKYTFDAVLTGHTNDSSQIAENKQLREAEPDIILIGAGKRPRDEVMEELPGVGLDGYVSMPFFLSNMEAEVNRVREARASTPHKDEAPLRGMKFLCAEDNDLNAEILDSLLEMAGATCTVYSDGAEIVKAFETVKPGDYDVILMDVQMPNMNGLEATRAIRNGSNPLGKTIPIIAMTANAFSDDIQRCLDAGMDAHLAKPVDMAEVERTVRRFKTLGGGKPDPVSTDEK